jgi:EAL domain-containing protein (putative c-di-GMP-specific phosphodiesterase class I)
VSKRHAQLRLTADGPMVEDLGSTNGTFVNGQQIQRALLNTGDIVQFSNNVFRMLFIKPQVAAATMEEGALPWAEAIMQFEQLMQPGGVTPFFQPIVRMDDAGIVGYESLARSPLEHLRNPAIMFSTAAKLGQERQLSEMLRRESVAIAMGLDNPGNLFLNTHPKEVIEPPLVESLRELRQMAPSLDITIEIHEAAIVVPESMLEFRDVLRELNMQLAYDDFGAGQARLDELAQIPPDCLKFDIKLIRDIDKAGEGRRELVRSLVRVVHQLGVTPLAEGVETEGEAAVCRDLGFVLAQGFYFGRPAPIESAG